MKGGFGAATGGICGLTAGTVGVVGGSTLGIVGGAVEYGIKCSIGE